MDVYDVIGTALAAITGLCHGKKRHNELAEAVTTLVTSLRRGTFVVACTKANAQTVLEASSSSGANVLSTPGGQPEQVTAQFLDPAKVEEILKPTRLALRSKSPKIAEASLQIVQTLIARGLVRGDADAPPGTANGVDDTVEDRGSNPSGVNSEGGRMLRKVRREFRTTRRSRRRRGRHRHRRSRRKPKETLLCETRKPVR